MSSLRSISLTTMFRYNTIAEKGFVKTFNNSISQIGSEGGKIFWKIVTKGVRWWGEVSLCRVKKFQGEVTEGNCDFIESEVVDKSMIWQNVTKAL
jgi:hypothetical protein